MTEITVTAEEHVVSVYVELIHEVPGNIQGNVQVILKTPDGMQNSVYSTTPVRRDLETASQEVKDAVATLTAAVLEWKAEDEAAVQATAAKAAEAEPEPASETKGKGKGKAA